MNLDDKFDMLNENFPLISVIITARNEEKMIKSCLTSILKQRYTNFEIIYVDAESSDKTFEIAKELEKEIESFKNCKRFICVEKNANSPAKGRNIGVKLSQGKFLAFTDADCIANQNWLNELITHLKKGDQAVGGPNVIKHFKKSKINNSIDKVLGTFLGNSGAPQFLKINKITEVYAIPACNLSVTRKTFDKLNGFNENLRYNEDTDFCYRLTKSGSKIIYNPEAIVDHYMGLDSFKEFSKFVFNYGIGRGKNIRKNSKLLSPIHLLALSTIFTIISLSIVSIFFEEGIIPLLIIILICFSIVLGNSVYLSIKNRSGIVFILSFCILISEYFLYNIGFLKGVMYARKE